MSFHEHQASYDVSFNSESHLRRLLISVLDPSRQPPRRAVANLLQGYLARLGMKN
jgi:hypothetical protein